MLTPSAGHVTFGPELGFASLSLILSCMQVMLAVPIDGLEFNGVDNASFEAIGRAFLGLFHPSTFDRGSGLISLVYYSRSSKCRVETQSIGQKILLKGNRDSAHSRTEGPSISCQLRCFAIHMT